MTRDRIYISCEYYQNHIRQTNIRYIGFQQCGFFLRIIRTHQTSLEFALRIHCRSRISVTQTSTKRLAFVCCSFTGYCFRRRWGCLVEPMDGKKRRFENGKDSESSSSLQSYFSTLCLCLRRHSVIPWIARSWTRHQYLGNVSYLCDPRYLSFFIYTSQKSISLRHRNRCYIRCPSSIDWMGRRCWSTISIWLDSLRNSFHMATPSLYGNRMEFQG